MFEPGSRIVLALTLRALSLTECVRCLFHVRNL